MTHSQSCTNLVAEFEGCVLHTYKDIRGVLTIGYGHTGTDVHPGSTCTTSEAKEWLSADLAYADKCVTRNVKVAVTQQ